MKEIPDLKKFKKLKTKEQFNWIVKNYNRDLYWVIRPIVKTHENADDVLQNVFLKVYKALPNFRYESKLFSWLYRIAVNESLSYLKKYTHNNDNNEVLLELLKSDPYFDGDEIILKLEKAILHLPPKQQEVFRLKYFNNKKFREIAEITETSVGSLKASYHLAVKKIKKEIQND